MRAFERWAILDKPKHRALHLRRLWRVTRLAAIAALLPALVYAATPYVALWRLDRAVRSGDTQALTALVDIQRVRTELTRRLDKDEASLVGAVSDEFIAWLEKGIRQYGARAVEQLVTLDWIRKSLEGDKPGAGFLGSLSYAFFDAPNRFGVRIGHRVHLELYPGGGSWRVAAVYF